MINKDGLEFFEGIFKYKVSLKSRRKKNYPTLQYILNMIKTCRSKF